MVAWITVVHQIGSALAAYFAGVQRIAFDTYFESFILAGSLLISVTVLVLFIGTGREQDAEPAIIGARGRFALTRDIASSAAGGRLGGGHLLHLGFGRRGAESEPDPVTPPFSPVFDRVGQRNGGVGDHLKKCDPLLRG